MSETETTEQKSERLRKQRERDAARHTAQTASQRQAILQRKNTGEHERMAAENLAIRTEGDKQEKYCSFVCTIDSKTQVFNITLSMHQILTVQEQPISSVPQSTAVTPDYLTSPGGLVVLTIMTKATATGSHPQAH